LVTLPPRFELGTEFHKINYGAWRAKVESELKGASFDKRMTTHFYEGIELQPLYTEEIFATAGDPAGLPGFSPFVRGTETLGHRVGGWDIRQEEAHYDPAVANAHILEELNGGVTSIDLRFDGASMHGLDPDDPRAADLVGHDGVSIATAGDIARVTRDVDLTVAGLHLDPGSAFLPAAALYVAHARRAGIPLDRLRGGFVADPLKALMRDGSLLTSLDTALAQMADLAAWTSQNLPCMTAVDVSTTPYHNAGTTAVADVAFAVATGLDYLRVLTDAGLGLEAAARQFTFSMGLGCRFYLAIAKIRAARLLWAQAVAACGGSPEAQKMHLRVTTGRRVMTTRNRSLNILRNTVACYAGAVAGADVITTTPFDAPTGLPTEGSRHNARNTQLILAEECHLSQVVDPAGGAWYLEWYTHEIARRAWSVLQEVEAQGGMIKAVLNGWVARQVRTAEAARERDAATRKLAVTGVSEHPTQVEYRTDQEVPDFDAITETAKQRVSGWRRANPSPETLGTLAATAVGSGALTAAAIAAAERGATLGDLAAALTRTGEEPTVIAPLAVHPYAKAYEELRDAADAFEARRGRRPRVHVAGVGSIAEQVARKNYARNFFEAGGFEVIAEERHFDIEDAAEAFARTDTKIAVICSTDRHYATVVPELAARLKQAGARTVVLAGRPGEAEEAWRAAGVDRFIYMRCDVLETLWTLLREEDAES